MNWSPHNIIFEIGENLRKLKEDYQITKDVN